VRCSVGHNWQDVVHARHILFQVTPSVNVPEVRARAEQTLAEVLAAPEVFETRAAQLSNCPSGQTGGNLGQIGRGDTAPEFERAVFRLGPTGILPELVKSRYGFTSLRWTGAFLVPTCRSRRSAIASR
jgi:peptidyl-prolyl cis-trans isomerase C